MSRYFLFLVLLAIILELSSGQIIKCFGNMQQNCLASCPPPNTSRCILDQSRNVQCHCIPYNPYAPTIGVGNPCNSDKPPAACGFLDY